MPARHRSRRLPLLALACLLGGTGCTKTGAPPGFLSPAREAALEPYGAWIRLEAALPDPVTIEGEFIAVGERGVFVLEGRQLREIAFGNVQDARLATFDPETNRITGWVGAGVIASASGGFVAACTAPLWVVAGCLGGANPHTRSALSEYPSESWSELRRSARYPQGPPPGLRDLQLEPKYRPAGD